MLSQISAAGYQIAGVSYDQVILTTGAWLGQILEPPGYQVDVRPQKATVARLSARPRYGRLSGGHARRRAGYHSLPKGQDQYGSHSVRIEMGFDLTVDQALLNQMEDEALSYYPDLAQAEVIGERVGTRAYTSDFSPFGEAFLIKQAFMSQAGLGSSGGTYCVPVLGGYVAELSGRRKGALRSSGLSS